jgi:glycosyltransferase involved in cell wall biosynthesis
VSRMGGPDRAGSRPTMALVVPRYPQSDPGVTYPPHYQSIVRALEGAGWSVTLVRPLSWMLVFRTFDKSLLFVSPRLVFELLRDRQDAIAILEYNVGLLWAALAARLRGVRLYVFQENAGYGGRPLSGIRRIFRRGFAALVDGFLANTTAAATEIVRVLQVEPTRVLQVPLFYPPERDDLQRRPLDLEEPDQRPLLLFVGRLAAEKNVQTLLGACSILDRRGFPFSVWIVGEGPLRSRYEAETARLSLQERVHFFGWIPRESLGFIYEESDVFIMPSIRDYRCVSVLEAMRFGKPILDSRQDGNAGDTVRDGVTGFLFDPHRPEQLADHIQTLIRQPKLIKEMGRRAQNLMDREYSPEVAVERLRRALIPTRERRR